MTDNKSVQSEAEKSTQPIEAGEDVLEITSDQILNYLSNLEKDSGAFHCPVCKCETWNLPSRYGSQDHPCIVTIPLPKVKGVGMWAFPIYCDECGFMALFNATTVSKKIFSGKDRCLA